MVVVSFIYGQIQCVWWSKGHLHAIIFVKYTQLHKFYASVVLDRHKICFDPDTHYLCRRFLTVRSVVLFGRPELISSIVLSQLKCLQLSGRLCVTSAIHNRWKRLKLCMTRVISFNIAIALYSYNISTPVVTSQTFHPVFFTFANSDYKQTALIAKQQTKAHL